MIALRRSGAFSDAAVVAEEVRHKISDRSSSLDVSGVRIPQFRHWCIPKTFTRETLDDDIEKNGRTYRIHRTDAKHKACF